MSACGGGAKMEALDSCALGASNGETTGPLGLTGTVFPVKSGMSEAGVVGVAGAGGATGAAGTTGATDFDSESLGSGL
jgi:hypothetical protein